MPMGQWRVSGALLLFVEPLVVKNFGRYPVDGLDDRVLGLSDVDLGHMWHLHHI